MRSIKKYIYIYLSSEERMKVQKDISFLSRIANTDCHIISSKQELIDALGLLENFNDSLVIQLIAHGNCDGFCSVQYSDPDTFISYSEIAPILSKINRSSNNRLILNLMTVCKSAYLLPNLNQGSEKIYKYLIASIKDSPLHGSILYSIKLYDIQLFAINSKIDEINYDSDDYYSIDDKNTFTYILKD